MLDVGCSMFDVGCWMLDVRCSMFDVRCSMFDVRCSMFDVLRFEAPFFLSLARQSVFNLRRFNYAEAH
jgi:hypothetical protein